MRNKVWWLLNFWGDIIYIKLNYKNIIFDLFIINKESSRENICPAHIDNNNWSTFLFTLKTQFQINYSGKSLLNFRVTNFDSCHNKTKKITWGEIFFLEITPLKCIQNFYNDCISLITNVSKTLLRDAN